MEGIINKVYFLLALLILLLATVGMPACLSPTESKDVLFQTSMLSGLSKGYYDGDVTYKELEQNGDFGLGTFDDLDGEEVYNYVFAPI